MDKYEKQFEDFAREIKFDDSPDIRHRHEIELNLLDAFGRQQPRPTIWRIIMKSNITKLAVAAAIILITALGITILEKSTKPAYAIEQTIEAMKHITTAHIFYTDWDDKKGEMWFKLDPNTSKVISLYGGDEDFVNISEPNRSYFYRKKANLVEVYDRQLAHSDLVFRNILEKAAEWGTSAGVGESVKMYGYTDPNSGENFIMISLKSKTQEWEIAVNPETKLPARLNALRSDNMSGTCKSIDKIYYNEAIPSELTNFEIPPGTKVVNGDPDPNSGISTAGITNEQAAAQIAEEYWNAAINGDWERVAKLRPWDGGADFWKKSYSKNPPIELVEVGTPYQERGCSGLLVPCVVKFTNGKVFEIILVTDFREMKGRSFCFIPATWGKNREIK